MPDSVGIDRRTWKVLTDWDHVRQSIEDILTTRVMTRVMLREYGSELQRLIDAPMSEQSLLLFYVAVAEALMLWEPRFHLLEVLFDEASADGRAVLRLVGDYLPRGHLGDPTPARDGRYVLDLVQNAALGFRSAT